MNEKSNQKAVKESKPDNSTKLLFKHFIEQQTQDMKVEKTVAFIKDVVAKYYKLEPSVYESKHRFRHIVECKHVAVYLTGEFLNLKLVEMASYFYCDHATIIHACKKITNHLSYDKQLQRDVALLSEMIKNRDVKVNDELDADCYFIDLSDIISMKLGKRKAVIFVGFSEDDIDNAEIIDRTTGKKWTDTKEPTRRHKDKGIYILEKTIEDEDKDKAVKQLKK
jgi:hypothetical protein